MRSEAANGAPSEAARSIEAALAGRKMPDAFVRGFLRAVGAAASGNGYLAEETIEGVSGVPVFDETSRRATKKQREATVAITLNGGLGTTMRMSEPKALLDAAEGMTFLEIALRQAEFAGVRPLLMNSFATDGAIRKATRKTAKRPKVASFLQHEAPKLRRSDFTPVRVPEAPALEWCPPGHGDLYTALGASGLLAQLLDEGFRYAFISNVDNVGGSPDPRVLGSFIRSKAPFLMEVVRRSAEDWKGGHLARRKSDGRLVLRETAQCAPADRDHFADHNRYRYFNANNLWLRLPALAEVLERENGFLPLPTIVNPKTADPADPDSTRVFQLEHAAGSAIEVFEGATAFEVPRRRFAPVKTTENLLVLRSDIYAIDEHGLLEPAREPPPVVLDHDYFWSYREFDSRFPYGPPSLLACDRLEVNGDVRFGKGVVCEGEVTVRNGRGDRPARISDGTRLNGLVTI